MLRSVRYTHIFDNENDIAEAVKKLMLSPQPVASEPYPKKAPSTPFAGKKSGPLYGLHPYWSKKPYDAIKASILEFTREGEVVFDPFCGSGSTLLAAILSNRRSFGLDLSPAAFHISQFFTFGLCGAGVERNLVGRWLSEIDDLTKDVRQFSMGGAEWEIDSLIYSEQYRCPKCFTWRSLYARKEIDGNLCCDSPGCKEIINTRSPKLEYGEAKVVSAELRNLRSKKTHTFDVNQNQELSKILMILEDKLADHLRETRPPEGYIAQELLDLGGRLNTTHTSKIADLYTPRSLYILSLSRDLALKRRTQEERTILLGILTAVSLNCTKMYRVREGGGGGPATSFYVPPIRKEISVLDSLRNKSKELLRISKGIPLSNSPTVLGMADITQMMKIPANTVDYIFTDPPYADTMPYGALNCVWESWIGATSEWRRQEVLGDNWENGMRTAFLEMARVLKPGRWLTLCYHDTSEGTWMQVQDMAAEAGLIPDESENAIYISTTQKSWQQQVGGKVVKRDLLVHFLKPTARMPIIAGGEDQRDFNEQARAFLINLLSSKPGMPRDRIYDELVSHSVRRGRIEPHDFDALLSFVAERAEDSTEQWFLKSEHEAEVQEGDAAAEEAAAAKIDHFVRSRLADFPELEGVHFSDIFSYYITAVKNKPRRSIQDWLLDFFYRTSEGLYRPPASVEEAQEKDRVRAAGTNRRIKRHLAYVQGGLSIPEKFRPTNESLVEWIRHCKRNGLYEPGKVLYERGGLNLDKLSDAVMVNVEEDYQVCVRMLARGTGSEGEGKAKRGRRKKSEAQ